MAQLAAASPAPNGPNFNKFALFLLGMCSTDFINLQKHAKVLQYTLGIQIRNPKMDLNMEALSIGCRNKH